MKPFLTLFLLGLLGVQIAEPAFAARRVVVRKGPYHRTTVVVHRGWPIKRPARVVYVRPDREQYRVRLMAYLPVVRWPGAVVLAAAASTPALSWEDGETLVKDQDWTEVGLGCNRRGTALWLDVTAGKAQFDWAEVVFENGEAQVVDMNETTRGPGIYPLLDFRDGRMVDHVRLVARARSEEARVVLRMSS